MQATALTWWIVGAGSLLLLVAVVVLARLKWTQSQPIRACIVLSVFAHILLLTACYLTQLFDLPYVGGADRMITLRVSLDDVTVDSELETTPDLPTTEAAPSDETAVLDAACHDGADAHADCGRAEFGSRAKNPPPRNPPNKTHRPSQSHPPSLPRHRSSCRLRRPTLHPRRLCRRFRRIPKTPSPTRQRPGNLPNACHHFP